MRSRRCVVAGEIPTAGAWLDGEGSLRPVSAGSGGVVAHSDPCTEVAVVALAVVVHGSAGSEFVIARPATLRTGATLVVASPAVLSMDAVVAAAAVTARATVSVWCSVVAAAARSASVAEAAACRLASYRCAARVGADCIRAA